MDDGAERALRKHVIVDVKQNSKYASKYKLNTVIDNYILLVPVPVLVAVAAEAAEDLDTPFVLVSVVMEVVFHVAAAVVVEEVEEVEREERHTAMVVWVEIHIDLVAEHNFVDFEMLRSPVESEEAHSLEDSDSAMVRIHVNCNSEEQCMTGNSVMFRDVMTVNMNKSVAVVASEDRDNSHLTA